MNLTYLAYENGRSYSSRMTCSHRYLVTASNETLIFYLRQMTNVGYIRTCFFTS